ncbi:MAG: TPMT family class I SAM-dependent methyltransferase [Flavobacteriales bacterium]|nr:TPMT family class I SAM-dependent methyltransferase [Flavobacteriales bacterium]
MNLDKTFWSSRYEQGETGWDIGYASPALIAYMENKPRTAKVLIPGAGNSYEAEKLWEMGFKNITVLDLSEIPLANLKTRIPDFPEKQLVCDDFFNHKAAYDIILEQTFFCALSPDLRTKYVQKMAELLAPGGELAGLLFDAPMNAEHPPFGGNKAEYLSLFGEKLQVLEMEACPNSIAPRMGKEVFFRAIVK